MKEKWFTISTFVIAVVAAQTTLMAAVWSFDAVQPADKSPDVPHGYFEWVEGVSGKAGKFDGFTTKVVRKAGQGPQLGQRFTIEAWIAPHEFSLNQTAIINCEKDHLTGYFFGIDNQGRLLIQANIGGQWQTCTSDVLLPVLCWSHVAATVDADKGLTLYMNGKPVGSNPVKGPFMPAQGADTWIGMSQMKQVTVPVRSQDPELFSWMVFDGLIDELKVHKKALSAGEVDESYKALKPGKVRVLEYRKMPSGPKDGKRFGAFYTRLNYSPEWEKQWRVGDRADVVVTFEDPRANFVFWRGTSYIPHWVTQNDIWYNNQFVERRSNTDGCIGCVEPMSDKKCRFSHVRVLHSTPARTVIHWRYAPIGLKHKHPYIDPYSGLGDWVDEYYTIYPDMVGVRSITLHSTAIDEFTDWQEAIIVHPPGRMPEDNIKATALSIGNLKGEVTDYTWPETSRLRNLMNVPARGCIQVVNLKSDVSPFMIVPPTDNIKISLFRNHGPNSMFRHWNHWPVAHGMSSTTPAFDASKPSHTSLTSWKNWELYRSTDNSRTHLMLHGVTDKRCKDLAILGKSWISPAEAKVVSGNYRSDGFDMEQRAYVVKLQDIDKADALHLKFDANPGSPLVNPAIVVKNWPDSAKAKIEVAGRELDPADIKIGIEKEIDGNNLVVSLKLEASELTEIRIKPLPVMAEEKEQPPNFIFLMADDLGYGDTGFNGNKVIRTPNLDAMAQDGIRFTRFYSMGPVCAPTRASCLTGRHYMRFGMMDVNVGKLPEQEITLAKVCKAKGYATGHFGKWHLGTMSKTESPRHKDPAKDYAPPWTRDYDDAFASEISVPTWNPASGKYKQHDAPYWHNGKKVTDNLDGDDSRVIMDRAIPFIQKAVGDDTPFMTTIWFHAPHSPVVAGPNYLKMYEGYTEGQQHYYGCITAMDEQIGRLRKELKKLGIDKNTIIWFCSDNGPEGSGKPKPIYDAYSGAYYGKTGGLRGRKRFLYNGGVCVPAVAVWPGTVTKGQTVHVPCSTLDYLPTVCEAIGSDYPDDRPVDGESLLSLLLGKTKTRKSYIPFASNIRLPRAAIIKGDFKLCTNVSFAEEDALYHLQDDPAESDNLIADEPKLAESMKADLQAWIESCRKSFGGNDYREPYEKQGTFLRYGE